MKINPQWLNRFINHERVLISLKSSSISPMQSNCSQKTYDLWHQNWQHHPNQKTAIMELNYGSEGQARNLKNHIAELESRLAHPHHWTEGENKQNAEKLRQLIFERQRLISTQDDELSNFIWQIYWISLFWDVNIMTLSLTNNDRLFFSHNCFGRCWNRLHRCRRLRPHPTIGFTLSGRKQGQGQIATDINPGNNT